MFYRQVPLDRVAPWLVSGASGVYIVARTRRLSKAKASRASLTSFLVDQSDIILMLCGSPVIWHLSRRMSRRALRLARQHMNGAAGTLMLSPLHKLRQVFTALLIGTGLLVRKASEGKTTEMIALAHRLHAIVLDGATALASLDELRLIDLLDHGVVIPKQQGQRG